MNFTRIMSENQRKARNVSRCGSHDDRWEGVLGGSGGDKYKDQYKDVDLGACRVTGRAGGPG